MSLCSVQCSLWLLSICSLPPLCSSNERHQSSCSLTSKRCSSQSLLPAQHSAVPRSYRECQLPSNHDRCYNTGGASTVQNFRSHCITFTGTYADLSTHTQCHICYCCKQSGAFMLILKLKMEATVPFQTSGTISQPTIIVRIIVLNYCL
jgi:hypothetical protein